MSQLDILVSHIYHEKQEQGSMLCAQHALNSLLQGNYFTAPGLSDIARNLDILERSFKDNNLGESSTNMDDTGFFSVQVLENALKIWNMTLTRWRGEDMRSCQDHPQLQRAFILNLEQHWFTLRRFGNFQPDADMEANGLWFNLNSFLPAPEWVGELYLGMVLQQAEVEGYSVFSVTQADPKLPVALPGTEADLIASTLSEPRHRNASIPKTPFPAGFEDEDVELQAALEESLLTGQTSKNVPSDSISRANSTVSYSSSQPAEIFGLDEIRRRRLARFGT